MENWKEIIEDKTVRINIFNVRKDPIRQPNKEGLRILASLTSHFLRTYPKTCNTDDRRFIYLSKMFNNNQISKDILIELALVLKIKEKQLLKKISKVINDKAMGEIKW